MLRRLTLVTGRSLLLHSPSSSSLSSSSERLSIARFAVRNPRTARAASSKSVETISPLSIYTLKSPSPEAATKGKSGEMAKKHKKARLDDSSTSGESGAVPREKRQAIIDARRSKDGKAALEAIKSLLETKDIKVPVDLASVALSTLCDEEDLDKSTTVSEVLSKLYQQSKENSPTEAFFSTAVRAFLKFDTLSRALEVVEEMKAAGHPPKHRTLSPILSNACGSDSTLRIARKTFQSMSTSQASAIEMVNEDDVSVILESCARAKTSPSSASSVSSASEHQPLSHDELNDFVQTALKDCAHRATEPPSDRLVSAAKQFFSSPSSSQTARALDADNKCASCSSKILSVEPDESQLNLVIKQTEALVPSLNPKKKEDWDKFLAWERKNMARFDTVVDGANIAYFRATTTSDPEPKYEQADLVMKKLKEMGRKPLLFFHARHFTPRGVKKELETRWRSEQSLFVVPHGHNDDVFWLHMSLLMGPRNWMVTNDQMRDHRFEMIQSTTAFAKWKERHHVAYDVVWVDTDKKLSVNVHPPLTYSVQLQRAPDTNKWHLPIRVPPTPEEAKAEEEKARLKTLTAAELRTQYTSGKITYELFRELRREALGCELPKTYGKKYEWLCL